MIILHPTHHAICLSVAVQIPSKHPKAIHNAILCNWISIYGSANQFLTDNGREFVNDDFLKLCEAFNINVKITGAEVPWSNDLVELHNLVLLGMLNKGSEDTKCPFDIALQWCVNAKKLLHKFHGFLPYQLALGQNPRLPARLSDKPPALESNSSSEIIRQNLKCSSLCSRGLYQERAFRET